MGPDFFNEEPSQDRKQAPHKRLEEALTMAQCDVSFVASDLMDGGKENSSFSILSLEKCIKLNYDIKQPTKLVPIAGEGFLPH